MMEKLILEREESEAARQAKLKGYRSIGFGRWVDKNGNLAAFTNKVGRLVPYGANDGPTEKKPATSSYKGKSSFITPFTSGGKKPDGTDFSGAVPRQTQIPDTPVDHLKSKYEYFASKYAAEALLKLLQWISKGKLSEEELEFYTSTSFRAFAEIMAPSVMSLHLALMDSESEHKQGTVKLDLDSLHQKSTLPEGILHVMLMDITNHGPSYIFAKSMKMEYAASADDYREHQKVLWYDFSKVHQFEEPNDEPEVTHTPQ